MVDIRTFTSWSKYLREAIYNLKEEGYHFNHIADMDNITLAFKRYMTYDFSLKRNMSDFEWKLNAMINKNKNHSIKFPQTLRQPINNKFECYPVQ